MRVTLSMDNVSMDAFKGQVQATISKVGRATRKATVQACEDILADSLEQVPKDTGTLANSAGYTIEGNYLRGFSGDVGYCITSDPVNIKSGERASEYAIQVHEDLFAVHPNGKAKYLEDPVRDYAKARYPRTVMNIVGNAIRETGGDV